MSAFYLYRHTTHTISHRIPCRPRSLEMLPTTQIMNSSYNMKCTPKKLYQTIQLTAANEKGPICP